MKFVFYCYAVSLMSGGAWQIFGENSARFGDLATFLTKNECSRNLKSRTSNVNRKRDLPKCSRSTGEIGNFARQAKL